MPDLSLQNIDQISRDINREGITFSHLLDDLIDHVCCDVEDEMRKGLDFAEAYFTVRKKMGSDRRLKEIQEETLYAVDTKYRLMKNTMKISGITGTILFGFATLLKIQHWAGSGIGFTLGGLILTFIFLPSALVVLWKETKDKKKIFLFVSAFIAGACFIVGTLFKIQHWPGAGYVLIATVVIGLLFFMPALIAVIMKDQENRPMRTCYILAVIGFFLYIAGLFFKIQHWPLSATLTILGIICLGFIALPWFTWVRWKEESHISPVFLYIIIGSLLLAVPGALVNLNLQKGFETVFYPKLEKQQATYNYLYMKNEALLKQFHDSTGFPKMEQIHSRTQELINFIDNVQTSMVQASEGKPAKSADKLKMTEAGLQIRYNRLSQGFALGPVRYYLSQGSETRKKLDTLVKDYTGFLSGFESGDDLKKMIGSIDASKYIPDEIIQNGVYSLIPALHSLALFRNSILSVESYMLKTVANN